MKTEKQIKRSKRSENVSPIILTEEMTLMQFKNLEYGDFDDDEFFCMLEEVRLVDDMWRPSKKAVKMNWLFVKDENATQQELDSELTSQGKVIMVGNYEFLSKTLEIHKTLEFLEFCKHYSKALQKNLSEE